MKQSGYSGTPLGKKLGVKPGFTLCTINAPSGYLDTISPLPLDALVIEGLEANADIVHAFVHNLQELSHLYPDLVSAIHKNGMIWISWPKQASQMSTDLNRDIIREFVLDQGLVDVKIASYDDTYSGLKFVYRTIDR